MWASDYEEDNAIINQHRRRIVRAKSIFKKRNLYKEIENSYQFNEKFKLTFEKFRNFCV